MIVRKWNNEVEVIQHADGSFDATTLATSFGKRSHEYLRLPRTIEYIEELSRELKMSSGMDEQNAANSIVLTQRGGVNPGTRFHPRLMIDYGRWLSVKFAVWLDAWVLELLSRGGKADVDDFDAALVRPERLYHHQALLINETDLHQTVVRAIRARWPATLFTAGLGELQITSEQRIEAWRKGYLRGQPDLLVFEKTAQYLGLAVEFKNPGTAAAVASEAQEQALLCFRRRGWKTLVSNDYDEIFLEVADFLRESRRRCECCEQLFASDELLKQHLARKRRRSADVESA